MSHCAQWLDGTVLPDGNWVLKGVALTRLSTVLNALVMAGLVWAGALSFKRVVRSESAQLVYCMQARPACTWACPCSLGETCLVARFASLLSTTQPGHDQEHAGVQMGRHSCIKCQGYRKGLYASLGRHSEAVGLRASWCVACVSGCVARAAQGITQLGLIFMQMGAVSFSVAIVDLLTAAVRWPGVALVVAVGVAGVSVVRVLALAVLVTRCPPGWDQRG